MPNEQLTIPEEVREAKVETYRFSVDQFGKMGEMGLFDGKPRVELLDGEIVVMSPIGKQHAGVVMRLTEIFILRLGKRITLNPQNPTVLDNLSEPLPDILLLKRRDDYYANAHPVSSDIFLLIEVSDTSLRYDRGRKLPKYAEAGISEVWIVNLQDTTIEQYREPAAGIFSHKRIFLRSDSITVAAFPDEPFKVEELIG